MFRSLAAGYLIAVVAFTGSTFPAQAADSSAEFEKLLEDHWDHVMRESPIFATRSGDHRFDDQLSKVSLADEARRADALQRFLRRLNAIDSEGLTASQKLSYAVFKRELSDSIQEHRFRTYLTPINNRTGFHIEFPELPNEISLLRTKDFENYIARLRGFGKLVDGNIELMREGMRQGLTMPSVILEGWQDSVTTHIVKDPEESLLYKPMVKFPQAVPASEHERLRTAAKQAIEEVVVPGYKKLEEFMQQEYVPNCRTSIGASGLPDGRDFYRFRVKHYTTLDMSPEEVHQRGLSEVQRIRKEMQAIVEKVEFDGDLAAFMEHLRTDKSFYAKTPEELLAKCSHILKSADGQLPKLFGRLPRMPYGLREIPAFIAPKTTSAYYMSPSGDGTIAGFFYLNTYNLPSRPLFALESLALHEAVPGHHLQLALQQEMENMPEFRKHGGFTAFIEGWALYAERLGQEIGFYEDPYSDFGRLSMEMWRACRLVVDSGMHFKGWSRDRAIEFMKQNSALSEHNIRAEIDRYIGWPGQALAYKTGELKIRELRARAEEELGERFDVRQFHDTVLGNGAVPLDVLDTIVGDWIAEQKRADVASR